MGQRFRCGLVVAAVFLSACTVNDTPAPALQGPSTLALSLTILANPDVLSQDGASQSQILVQARDANGQPAANIPFRAEISVGGTRVDYGTLSARTLVTGSDGRATLTYTAPPAPLVSVDTNTEVYVLVTPSGTDYGSAESRYVTIRLVPPGVINAPVADPVPGFTFSPATPTAFTNVVFDASESTPAGAITSYAWSFGDGGTAAGVTATHQFTRVDTFAVMLTVTNTNQVAKSLTQSVPVSAGAAPTASFVFSPGSPTTNQQVLFNASTSTAGAGRTIVRYDWNFGSGTPQSGVVVSKAYDITGTYNVVLTVTDDAGQTGTKSQTVTVSAAAQAPTALLSFSPSAPTAGQTVYFNGSASTTPSGTTISGYAWDFGDGGTATGSSAPSHVFSAAGTFVVRLTVTNSASLTGTTTQSVVVSSGLTADFTMSPTNPKVNTVVSFNANTSTVGTGATITSYDWDFGDGTVLTGQATSSATHPYTADFTYTVRLTIHDSLGRTATKTSTLTVSP
jgi:PKD repeat protein